MNNCAKYFVLTIVSACLFVACDTYEGLQDPVTYVENPDSLIINNDFVAMCTLENCDAVAYLGTYFDSTIDLSATVTIVRYSLTPNVLLKGDSTIRRIQILYPLISYMLTSNDNAPQWCSGCGFFASVKHIPSSDSLILIAQALSDIPIARWPGLDTYDVRFASEIARRIDTCRVLHEQFEELRELGPLMYHPYHRRLNGFMEYVGDFEMHVKGDEYVPISPEKYRDLMFDASKKHR